MLIASVAFADGARPKWITDTKLSDSKFYYVICSHEGLDPEDVRQVAESKCLASAAKLGGATVTVKQKTIQSLTGADSAEVAEVTPITRFVRCKWTDRYLEAIQNGFRVWLRCQVNASEVQSWKSENDSESTAKVSHEREIEKLAYKRATLTLLTVPSADRFIVMAGEGVRTVIEPKSGSEKIELKEGDSAIVVKKDGFKDGALRLGNWQNGDVFSKTILLEKGP